MQSRPELHDFLFWVRASGLSKEFMNKVKKLSAWLILSISLAGCAGTFAYRDGKDLVAKDNVEAGLLKFKEAIGHEPRNVEYKEAYLQKSIFPHILLNKVNEF